MENIKKQDDELFEFIDTSIIYDVHYIKNVYIDLKKNDSEILRKLEYILRSEICCNLNENITPYKMSCVGLAYKVDNRPRRRPVLLKHRDLANFLQPIIDNILIINEEEYKEL